MWQDSQHEAEEASTLFPKITAKTSVIHQAVRNHTPPLASHELPVVGTVKLHGTHADVVFPSPASSDEFRLQSRNRTTLTLENDNQGFAAFVLARKCRLLELKNRIMDRYQYLRPGAPSFPADHPLIIAGEFVGSGLTQLTGTAINTLPYQSFVVLGLKIAGKWQLDEDYASICQGEEFERDRIYHISCGGIIKETLDIRRTGANIDNLLNHMNAAAARCPFAASLGIEGGGEGIVWKPYTARTDETMGDVRSYWPPEFWLKTKAEEFWATQKITAQPKYRLGATRDTAAQFARAAVSERRLQQGLEYLEEMGMDTTKKTCTGDFIKWLSKDVMVEEALEIKKLGVPDHWVTTEVRMIAIAWFKKRIEAFDKSEGVGT